MAKTKDTPEKAAPRAPRPLETRRRLAGLNVAAMSLIGLCLLVMVNYINSRHYHRFDLTLQNRYSLSDKTKAVIGELTAPVEVTVLYQVGRQLDQVRDLLEEYDALAKGKLKIRYIDPARDIDEARMFLQSANLDSVEMDTVVFKQGDRIKAVPRSDVFEYQYNPSPYGPPPPPLFKGEQAFTSAILTVSQEKQSVIYFSSGHGEKSVEDYDRQRGYSTIATALKRDNYDVRTWNTATDPQVPDDCDVLVIAGPTKPFTPDEAKRIEEYVDNGGKLLLMIDPAGAGVAADIGLGKLLGDWNIRTRTDVIVLDRQIDPFGQQFISSKVAAAEYGYHEITDKIKTLATVYVNATVVEPQTGGDNESRHPVTLVKTSKKSWGETDISDRDNIKYDAGRDMKGPLSIGVAVSEGPPPGMPPGVPPPENGARLVVLGDSDFVVNEMISGLFTVPGNQDFFLGCVNWLAEKGALVAISPKPPEMRQADLSGKRQVVIFWTSVAGLPALVLVFGGIVWWRRRK